MKKLYLIVTILVGLSAQSAHAQVRIKDITDLDGARSNPIYGFGLVVGLDGTGSRSTATQQVAVDMLQKLNVNATIFSQSPADNVIRSTSISAVMVTAELGPFSRKGTRIDVVVSALDDARSLAGGMLLLTPLRGADREVYAVAQGTLSIGGFPLSGSTGRAQKNQFNTCRIPNGAFVEKEALGEIFVGNKFRLLLKDADYNTARLIGKAINERFPESAVVQDGGAVVVCVPQAKAKSPNAFVSEVGLCDILPDSPARVVINERTGTVVSGENVTITPVAVSHGKLFIQSADSPTAPANGSTASLRPDSVNRFNPLPKTTTVAELARAMNALGASPQDLIAIFQAMKQSGALHAEIVLQ